MHTGQIQCEYINAFGQVSIFVYKRIILSYIILISLTSGFLWLHLLFRKALTLDCTVLMPENLQNVQQHYIEAIYQNNCHFLKKLEQIVWGSAKELDQHIYF